MDATSIMNHINEQREKHGAGCLQWSNELAMRAQDRANREAAQPGSSLMTNRAFGENLAKLDGDASVACPTAACIRAVDTWQTEQSHYDYDNPGYSEATRNFAATVWQSMTHVGFGVGRGGAGYYTVAAVFSSSGGYLGEFTSNVQPAARAGMVGNSNNNTNSGSNSSSSSNGGGILSASRRPSSPAIADMFGAPSSVCVRERSVEIKELRSKDGRFRFVMQPDRSLALYMEEDAVWAIYLRSMLNYSRQATQPDTSVIRLVLLGDGNLVAVDSACQHVWASDTANRAPGPYTLTMQNDGNCVLCAGGGVRLWATDTHGWG